MSSGVPNLSWLESRKTRASSTSRVSATTSTPSLRRSKSSVSLKRTPQSVQSSRVRSSERKQLKKKDDRPIQDKTWQAKSLNKTQEYFQNDPQGGLILNHGRNLRPITINMFIQLVNIVLMNMDESFEPLTTTNYVEILPKHLTRLLYPGQVTSSMLKTASSMHSWPHILAILSWLVDLHTKARIADEFIKQNLFILPNDLSPSEMQELELQQFQSKISMSAFVRWNKKQDETQEIDNYADGLRQILNIDESSVTHMQQTEEKLMRQLQFDNDKIQMQLEEIKKEEAVRQKTVEAKQYVDEVLTEREEYQKKAIIRIQQMENDILKLRSANEKQLLKNENLDDKVSHQPLSKKEREIMLRNIEERKAKKQLIINERQHQQKISDEMEIRISQIKLETEEKVSTFNMKLLQPSLKHPELKEFCVGAGPVIGAEFTKEIEQKIRKVEQFNQLEEGRHKIDQEVSAANKKEILQKEQLVEAITKKNEEIINQIENMNNIIELSSRSEKKVTEEALKVTEAIQQEIADLQAHFPDINEIKRSIESKSEEYHKLKRKFLDKDQEMNEFFKNLEDDFMRRLPECKESRTKINKFLVERQKKINAVLEKYFK